MSPAHRCLASATARPSQCEEAKGADAPARRLRDQTKNLASAAARRLRDHIKRTIQPAILMADWHESLYASLGERTTLSSQKMMQKTPVSTTSAATAASRLPNSASSTCSDRSR